MKLFFIVLLLKLLLNYHIAEFSVFRKSEIHKAKSHFSLIDAPAGSLVPVFYLLVHFCELSIKKRKNDQFLNEFNKKMT